MPKCEQKLQETTVQEAASSKKNKKSKKTKKPINLEEKRLAPFRTECTSSIYERIIHAQQQRIYMVNRTKVNDYHEEFAILGSTGNFFVYLKVFRLNHDSQFIYQEALLSKELRSIFANAVPDPTVLASKRVCDKYSMFTSSKLKNKTGENEKCKPIEGNCPVCYELLEEKDHNNIVWCIEGCGNNLHKDCFEQWKKSKNSDKVTCVYCHANWVDPDSEILIIEEGYINLGRAQGMNTIRGYTNYF
ncbi:hypothetical protein RCL_jg2483.t1 [Rhizophagus clarus]|uniref:RING-type domain-containing protein n=1 Tax=Rhizophagus clarus TaxID=94130 RepID=A0A8H3L2R0_9GLOM|nr:hypothetical protein RCL_jg2483.t1 [Rhizophagus clarus]